MHVVKMFVRYTLGCDDQVLKAKLCLVLFNSHVVLGICLLWVFNINNLKPNLPG